MKTIEFKLYFTPTQEKRIDDWLLALKWVWNRCVFLQQEFNGFNYYHKADKRTYPACPINEYNHKLRESYPTCPIGWVLKDFNEDAEIYPVRLRDSGRAIARLNFFDLQPAFTHKEHSDKPWLTDIPSKFIDGRVKDFAESWQAFMKQIDRKPPRYKGKNDKIGSLIHNNSKEMKLRGDFINIPKIGLVKAKGLSDRWDAKVLFCPMKVLKKPSGYYLQLTGKVPTKERVRKKSLVAGIDAGCIRLYTDDLGNFAKPPLNFKKSLEKLAKLQRKAARQRSHPDNQSKKHFECKNLHKTYKRIARMHERIARQRRAFNHWQSSKLANQFETVYIEDLKLTNMVKKTKPVLNEAKTGYEKNGRKRKKGLSRTMLDVGIGQFYEMLGKKTNVVKVDPKNTSIICSHCGHKDKDNRLNQATFHCLACGFIMNADRNAAINIKRRGADG